MLPPHARDVARAIAALQHEAHLGSSEAFRFTLRDPRETAMPTSIPTSAGPVQPRRAPERGLFDRMIQAWLGHYQRLIDSGSYPL
jgi:hypothetical protein